MKRLNPKTNKPFKCGETREDGFVFDGYYYGRIDSKGYYKENWRDPEKYRKIQIEKKILKKQFYEKVTNTLNALKTNKGCQECGYNNSPYALEFHHRNKKFKLNNVSSYFRNSWKKLETIIEEYRKCDILCSNCHKILTQKELRDASREKILATT